MVIDVVGMMEKPFELAKLLVEEDVIDKEYVLLALGTGKKIGGSPYTCHRAVEVIGSQQAYQDDGQQDYDRTARKESIEWCYVFCNEEQGKQDSWNGKKPLQLSMVTLSECSVCGNCVQCSPPKYNCMNSISN